MGLLKDSVDLLVAGFVKAYAKMITPGSEEAIARVLRHVLAGGNIDDDKIVNDVSKVNAALAAGAKPRSAGVFKTLHIAARKVAAGTVKKPAAKKTAKKPAAKKTAKKN